MKGLYVDILRPADHHDGLNGIKNDMDKILLVDEKIDGLFEPKKDELYLRLVQREIWQSKPKYINAELWQNGGKFNYRQWNMFGGAFIYSCDSRFTDICDYPIPVHDRFEKPNKPKCSAFIHSEDSDGVSLVNPSNGIENVVDSVHLQNIVYRWLDEDTEKEQFQVLYDGEWYNAQSMDFEFE